MKPKLSRVLISFTISIALTALTYTNAWAAWIQTCNSLGGPNGSVLKGCNNYEYDYPSFGQFAEYSSSQVSGQYQPQMNMFADARPQDRCQNADGSWQAWKGLGYTAKSGFGSYIQTNVASGYYQNCTYGHQYRSESYHTWWYGSYSNSTWVDKII